jgi:hypothetical protein
MTAAGNTQCTSPTTTPTQSFETFKSPRPLSPSPGPAPPPSQQGSTRQAHPGHGDGTPDNDDDEEDQAERYVDKTADEGKEVGKLIDDTTNEGGKWMSKASEAAARLFKAWCKPVLVASTLLWLLCCCWHVCFYAVKRHRYLAGPPCRDKGATATFTMPLSCDGENNEQPVTVTVPGRGALAQASGGARSQFESAGSGGQYGSFERPPQRIVTWQVARPAPYLCPELPDR